jgi:hypothetical protein
MHDFRFDPSLWDSGAKTVFGKTGTYRWEDACRLVVDHPLHPSFFVRKLWSYFHPAPPSAGTQADLEALYTSTDHQIRPVLEAILMHPDLYQGPSHVKPPTVLAAGLLRILRAGISNDGWIYDCQDAGQRLFYPPNVSGWNDNRWLDTSTMRGRWEVVARSLETRTFDPWDDQQPYDPTETPEAALDSALSLWDHPPLSAQSESAISRFANHTIDANLADWQQSPFRAMRQNALRQLIAIAPDNQVS